MKEGATKEGVGECSANNRAQEEDTAKILAQIIKLIYSAEFQSYSTSSSDFKTRRVFSWQYMHNLSLLKCLLGENSQVSFGRVRSSPLDHCSNNVHTGNN